MFKVAYTGCYHRYVMSVAVLYGVVVADRAAWLNNSGDAGLVGYFHTVGKREERIGSHYCAVKVESE